MFKHVSFDAQTYVLVLFSLIACVASSNVGAQERRESLGAAEARRAIDQAHDSTSLKRVTGTRLKYIKILFASNREIDLSAEHAAWADRKMLVLEDVFLNRPSIALSHGWLEVSYPANRKRGEAGYGLNSKNQNPLLHFSVVNHQLVGSLQEFRRLLSGSEFARTVAPLIYVHGLDNSFSEAAERSAQLALDVGHSGLPFFFSWPSDMGQLLRYYPRLGISENSYHQTRALAEWSRSHLAYSLSEVTRLHAAQLPPLQWSSLKYDFVGGLFDGEEAYG